MSATTTSSTPAYLLEITALTDAVKAILLQNKTPSPALVKAIEKTCMTCGGPHPYYKCLATGGNTFDACVVIGTYNQGGNRYRPQGDPNYHASNQMGPPGFPPPNVQNSQNYNQNWYNQNQENYQAPNNQGFNQQRGQNVNQGNKNYQAPLNQTQVGPLNELSNYIKSNDELSNYIKSNEATLRAMQTQMSNMKSELRNEFKSSFTNQFSSIETKTNKLQNQNYQIMNMLTKLTIQRQSPSGSGSLPSDTVAKRTRCKLQAQQVPHTSNADALLHMPNFASTLKSLLSNKEKLFELANTPLMRIVRRCSLRSCPKNLETPKSNHTSSGSTTSHYELSLPDYEVFCFEEKSSGSTTTHFDYSLPEYDSFIFDLSIDPFPPANRSTFYHEEFADELALLDPFPAGNEDDNFNHVANLREIEYLLNRDPSTESSPNSDIKIIDPILERFTDEPVLVYSLAPGEDDDGGYDLFDLKFDNDEWKMFLYGDSYKDIDRENSLLDLDDPFLLDTPPPYSKLVSLEEDDYYNSEGDIIYLESLLNNDTIPYLPPEVFLEHVLKSLNDEPNIDDLNIKENVRFTFEDRHYLSLTFVIKIFLPFLTYLVNSLPLISSESEDLIFDPGISAYSFYSLEPMAYENPMIIFPFFCFCLKDKGIRGESS
ncbi:hypothetical protein Tco_0766758 [Tanacetum coccineum]